jgi:hypothetical protein
MKWTIIDGGEGYTKDTVKIDDGFGIKDMRLYDGDLKIVNAGIEDYSQYQDCVKCQECHEGSVAEMIAKGGKHTTVRCSSCHIGHPPEVDVSSMQCTGCHQPHSEHMTEDDCNSCHKAHTATEVTYTFDMPSEHCSACHQEAAVALASNRSKHSDMACALCHQETHKVTSTCQYCHSAPHPEHVMEKIGICGACHNTAHNLESARLK